MLLPFGCVWLACGASDGVRPTTEPGVVPGANADSATPDAGSADTGARPESGPGDDVKRTKLREDDWQFRSRLVGITTGAVPHVIYTREEDYYFGADDGKARYLEAVPITGGAPIRLAAYHPYRIEVSGGAVAWYDGTNYDNVANAIHLWTEQSGTKTVYTHTRPGLFAATEDGSRVAFSTNATLATSDIAVTTSAAPSAANPALTAANAVANRAVCEPHIAFAGATLVAGYCTLLPAVADDPNTTQRPKLVTVSEAGATVVRIDNALLTDAFQTRWYADSGGTKLFVLGPKPDVRGRVIVTSGPGTTTADVDPNVAGVDVAKDGSAVVYVSNGALKRATFAADPVVTTIVPTGVLTLLAMTADSKHALFSTAEGPIQRSDLNTVDVTANVPAPVALVATATVKSVGFNGAGTHVLYLDEPFTDENGITLWKLKSKSVGGGPEKVLDAVAFAAYAAPVGNGVLSVSYRTPASEDCGDTTLRQADSVAGGAPRSAATILTCSDDSVPLGYWSGSSFAYHEQKSAPGLYAITLP